MKTYANHKKATLKVRYTFVYLGIFWYRSMVQVFIKRYFEAGQIRLYSIQYLEAFDIMMYKLIETVLSLGVLGLDFRIPILEKP